MGGGKGGGGNTTTVQKADPWEGQQPYLTGAGGEWVLKPGATGRLVYDGPAANNPHPEGTLAWAMYNAAHLDDVTPRRVYDQSDYLWNQGTAGVFPEANRLYQSGQMAPAYYSGNTVAAQSPWTQQSLQLQADRALNGSPIIDVATSGMQNIMSGNALAQNQGLQTLNQLASADNPYTDELYNRANNQMLASMDSNFNRAGRYGSGAHVAAAADASGNLANQMYSALYDKRASAANQAGTLYNQGIGQQVLGSSQAQNLGNQAYTDAAALSEAGGVQDDYNQTVLNAAIDRYNYEAQRPLTALSNYNQLIQGNYGGTSTTTGQVHNMGGSKLGQAAGLGMGGAALGFEMGGPWGALIGGSLGGLLGLF